jgi:16S rRNA (cytidine1402-2'-O)-methyltransferase
VADLVRGVHSLQGLIAEGEKPARKYLRRFLNHDQMAALPLRLLNEHTKPEELKALLEPLKRGECWGVLSDAGLPCIADPGAELVSLARKESILIETYPGPSSLLYALQLSGFPAQRFAFHGYLPRESPALEEMIRMLEKRSQAESSSQLFIEAPYRSAKLLATLLSTLKPTTKLCVTASLTSTQEKVVSKSVAEWKQKGLELSKEPAVFVVFSS